MNRNWRTAFYAAAGAALIIALLAAPGVWATPGQNFVNQTVPTMTPSPIPVTPEPPSPEAPPATPAPPPATSDPGGQATVAPTATTVGTAPAATSAPAQQRSPLTLTLVADRQQVWSGANVTFTLTVTNAGRTALQQVNVEDLLGQGLEPGVVSSGDARWDGKTLRASAPTLAAGAKLVLVYTARVTATVPGQAIITRASATAAGGARAAASLTLGLPPSELPATGG
jgi:large repetitive protein